jgi:hypothetical protein
MTSFFPVCSVGLLWVLQNKCLAFYKVLSKYSVQFWDPVRFHSEFSFHILYSLLLLNFVIIIIS